MSTVIAGRRLVAAFAAVVAAGATYTVALPPPVAAAVTRWEAEVVAPEARVADANASGGAFARTVSVATAGGVPAGAYVMQARVKATRAARADIRVADAMVGSWGVGTAWRTVQAVVRIDATTQTVGVTSQPLPGATTAGTVDVDWFSLSPTTAGYTVGGGEILSPTGEPVVFRGVNVSLHATKKDAAGRLILDEPQGAYVDAWGADIVRYTLNQEHWLANCPVTIWGQPATRYRQAVIADVADLTARGIVAMLKLGVTERGRNTGCALATRPYLKEMADFRSLTFWKSVASTFKANPLVVFDLYNEPRGVDDRQWRNGGTVSYTDPNSGTFQAVGMQALYNAVRSTGATNVTFAAGRGWASDPRVAVRMPLDGYGIALSSHVYCADCPDWAPALPDTIDQYNSPELRARHPLVVTEFGWKDPDNLRFNRQFVDWAEPKRVGWVGFGFLPPGELSLVDEWTASFDVGAPSLTKEPSRGGFPVWNTLAPARVARGYQAAPFDES